MLDWIKDQMRIDKQSFLSDDWTAVGRKKRTQLA
jgi:hypothetical protein